MLRWWLYLAFHTFEVENSNFKILSFSTFSKFRNSRTERNSNFFHPPSCGTVSHKKEIEKSVFESLYFIHFLVSSIVTSDPRGVETSLMHHHVAVALFHTIDGENSNFENSSLWEETKTYMAQVCSGTSSSLRRIFFLRIRIWVNWSQCQEITWPRVFWWSFADIRSKSAEENKRRVFER